MVTAVVLLMCALGTGAFTSLWSFCLGDPHDGRVSSGRILSALGKYLLDRFHEREHIIGELKVQVHSRKYAIAKREWESTHKDAFPKTLAQFRSPVFEPINWWKSTGVCPRCFNVWLTLVSFAVVMALWPLTPWWLFAIVPYLGFSNLALGLALRLGD